MREGILDLTIGKRVDGCGAVGVVMFILIMIFKVIITNELCVNRVGAKFSSTRLSPAT